jgi:GAF domain-containing protein
MCRFLHLLLLDKIMTHNEKKIEISDSGYRDLDRIMKKLLENTAASRTTFRVDIVDQGITMNDIIAESVAPGVVPLKGGRGISDVRKTVKPVIHMVAHKEMLIQNDCLTAVPRPPEKLLSYYGVKAQMLSPVVFNDQLEGVISVHYNEGPREWSAEDVAALDRATSEVGTVLGIS